MNNIGKIKIAVLTYFPPFVRVVKVVKVFRVEKVDSETHYTGWQAVAVFSNLCNFS